MHCSKCVSFWGTSYSRPPVHISLPPVTKSWRRHWYMAGDTAPCGPTCGPTCGDTMRRNNSPNLHTNETATRTTRLQSMTRVRTEQKHAPSEMMTRHDTLRVTHSGRLPIRQNRQLPKARHGAGVRPVQRKARKMFY